MHCSQRGICRLCLALFLAISLPSSIALVIQSFNGTNKIGLDMSASYYNSSDYNVRKAKLLKRDVVHQAGAYRDEEEHLVTEDNLDTPVPKTNFLNVQFPTTNTSQYKQSPLCDPYVVSVGGNEGTGKIQYGVSPHCLPPMERDGDECRLRNERVVVMDAKELPWYLLSQKLPAVSFNCLHGYQDSINGGYSPATDAFRYIHDAISALRDWYNFDMTAAFPIHVFVHVGKNLENAWFVARPDNPSISGVEHSRLSFWLLLGDGNKRRQTGPGLFWNQNSARLLSTFPFSTPNIVGHETGHVIIMLTSLLRASNEAMAIHEAFADMTGEMLEYYVTGTVDWYVAREIYYYVDKDNYTVVNKYDSPSKLSRNFFDPSLDGISFSRTDNISLSHKLNSFQASGIYRHAFYLAAQKLGIRDAYGLFLRAARVYWASDISLRLGACGVLAAAAETNSVIADVVRDAFGRVGIETSVDDNSA